MEEAVAVDVELDPDLLLVFDRFVEQVGNVEVLDAFDTHIRQGVQARRRALEDREWKAMEEMARRFGYSLAEWVAKRQPPRQTSPPSSRQFSKPFHFDPITGSWAVKLGREPAWVQERLDEGFSSDDLTRPAGAFETTKGVAYWYNPESGAYSLKKRADPPKHIQRLLDQGLSLREVSRPPLTWSAARGRVEPSQAPPPLSDPLPARVTPEPTPDPQDEGQEEG